MATSQRFVYSLLATAALLGSAATASAQCPPGMRCGGAAVYGPRGGGARVFVQVGRPAPAVVYAPPPPVVVVRPAPPPPVVYTVPAQPQTVYVRPAPQQTVIVRQAPTYQQRTARGKVGLHFSLTGAGGNGSGLGGISAALRIRPVEHFALDFGIGALVGHTRVYEAYVGQYDQDRVEVPLTIDGLFFVNPQHLAQLYFVGGPGFSFASLRNNYDRSVYDHAFTYFGGTLGGGIEFRLREGFALNLEARAFMRHRIDSSAPEYSSIDGTNTTNRTIGFLASAGLTVYF